VSEEYVENTSILLSNVCKQLGLTIALITHEEGMLNYADKIYKASSVKNKLKLSEIVNGNKKN
jgi:ABC-type lipoprotein export system ATPase subunit